MSKWLPIETAPMPPVSPDAGQLSPSFDEIAAAYKKVFGEDLYGVGHTKRERIQRFVWLLFGGVDA